MENSCRKKYKPSSKKWILASRHTGFRRNSALVPANAGLFHYAGNNPIRYIDPDGRETAFSRKISDNQYVFSSQNTFEASIQDILSDIFPIPFLGKPCVNLIDKSFGYKAIDQKNGYKTLTGFLSRVMDVGAIGKKGADFLNVSNKFINGIRVTSDIFPYILAIADIVYEVKTQKETAGIDHLVRSLFHRELKASSHENLEALYVFAKCGLLKMKKDGDLGYELNFFGDPVGIWYDADVLNELKKSIKALSEVM